MQPPTRSAGTEVRQEAVAAGSRTEIEEEDLGGGEGIEEEDLGGGEEKDLGRMRRGFGGGGGRGGWSGTWGVRLAAATAGWLGAGLVGVYGEQTAQEISQEVEEKAQSWNMVRDLPRGLHKRQTHLSSLTSVAVTGSGFFSCRWQLVLLVALRHLIGQIRRIFFTQCEPQAQIENGLISRLRQSHAGSATQF